MNIYVDDLKITDYATLMDKMIHERLTNLYLGKDHVLLIEQGGHKIQAMMDKGII